MNAQWEATTALRVVKRPSKSLSALFDVVLQQMFITKPADPMCSPEVEWRDVPVVTDSRQ